MLTVLLIIVVILSLTGTGFGFGAPSRHVTAAAPRVRRPAWLVYGLTAFWAGCIGFTKRNRPSGACARRVV
jgi:hypothetical protein